MHRTRSSFTRSVEAQLRREARAERKRARPKHQRPPSPPAEQPTPALDPEVTPRLGVGRGARGGYMGVGHPTKRVLYVWNDPETGVQMDGRSNEWAET
jgi:hypothetical protein